MKKTNLKIFPLLLVLALTSFLLFGACSSDSGTEETIESVDITPSNLSWSINIVGESATNPNGNGSGIILIKASAKNAVRYGFKFDNNPETENTTGEIQHTFIKEGVNNYTVRIAAYSSTDGIISISKVIPVLVAVEEEQIENQGLVWADEFNDDGSVSNSNWFSETVPPNNGSWFNAEQQHYTDRMDNAYVSDGTLKIVAKKEIYTAFNSTKSYTSARLNSKFAFTYGRIEVRAKLPDDGGTWPAIWTLGSNLDTIGWPFCGEIDIMEHVGNNIGGISSAIHTPSSNGNTINIGRIDIPSATTEFHVYAVDWSAEKMDFYVDDTLYYTYNPTIKNSDTWPFDSNQFILLNIAMGGTLGGNIATNFESGTMEIDYVRVYQGGS